MEKQIEILHKINKVKNHAGVYTEICNKKMKIKQINQLY